MSSPGVGNGALHGFAEGARPLLAWIARDAVRWGVYSILRWLGLGLGLLVVVLVVLVYLSTFRARRAIKVKGQRCDR